MVKHARYAAEFFDRNNRKYRIEILQEVEEAPEGWPLEITLAADPVTIEWSEVEKLDPVQGSCATLRLVSMNDRQFFDMYSVEYGSIELRIYRGTDNGFSLYWAGTLDPELFEEPYSYQDRYITELSFVDFAPLEYINWDGKGVMSIRSIITKCVEAAKFYHVDQYLELVATTTKSGQSVLECMVLAENFYDDDDDPMTMREVLEEVLRPFALRLLQKGGEIIVFDLHSLSTASTDVVAWRGTDASIEADRVYNNISVKLSPFHNETILDASIDPDEVLKEGDEGVISGNVYGYSDGWFGYGSLVEGTVYSHVAWRAHMKQGPMEYGNLKIKNGAWMFRVEPVYSGNEEALVMWSFSQSLPDRPGGGIWPNYAPTNAPFCALGADYNKEYSPSNPPIPIIETKPVYVSKDSTNVLILVQLEAMYDARYDWFNAADSYKIPLFNLDYSGQEAAIKSIPICFIPVVITLRDADGNLKYVYNNNNLRVGTSLQGTESGHWSKIEGTTNAYAVPSWLAYYPDTFYSTQGVMSNGWQTNKRVLDSKWNKIPLAYTTKNDGEYIPIPPESGYLVVEVCAGHLFQRWGDNRFTSVHNALSNTDPIYTERARTVAYKSVTIKLVQEYGLGELTAKDIEDVAWINKSAREPLDISTIVGTPNEKMPAARGALRDSDGEQVDTLMRGDHTGRAEKLLIGTAYSQYAERKNVLAGTVELIGGFRPLTDQAISGRYVLLSEIQSLEDSTSNIRMAEFSGDIYDSIEEKKE